MATLFRVEHRDTARSLWYDPNGNFRPLVTRLKDGKARYMPMDWDASYGLGGRRWYSACESIVALSSVFSLADIIELEGLDYRLYQFEVSDFRRNDWHALFTREDISLRSQIDIDALKRALLPTPPTAGGDDG